MFPHVLTPHLRAHRRRHYGRDSVWIEQQARQIAFSLGARAWVAYLI